MQSEIKKIAIKIYIGMERSTLYTVVTCNCPTTLEIVITSNPGLHAVPNNNPLGLFASKICLFVVQFPSVIIQLGRPHENHLLVYYLLKLPLLLLFQKRALVYLLKLVFLPDYTIVKRKNHLHNIQIIIIPRTQIIFNKFIKNSSLIIIILISLM